MDTTKESFQITLNSIAADAVKLGMLAAGVRLEYRHNGAGHAPYVYTEDADGTREYSEGRAAGEFLPVFTYKTTKREAMAALEACARALSHVARFQAARA